MIWEKIKNSLFAEEDDDFLDEEGIMELEKKRLEKEDKQQREKHVTKNEASEPKHLKIKEAIQKSKENISKKEEPKKERSVKVEEVQTPMEKIIKKPVSQVEKITVKKETVQKVEPVSDRRTRRTEIRKEYEIPEIVSPIFGGTTSTTTKEENKNERITKSRVQKNSGFSEVISPYFGNDEDEDEVVEAKLKASTIITCRHAVLKDEDIEKLSLDEIVKDDEKDDDVIQFSLFGGDQVIKEKEYTQELKVDKKEK